MRVTIPSWKRNLFDSPQKNKRNKKSAFICYSFEACHFYPLSLCKLLIRLVNIRIFLVKLYDARAFALIDAKRPYISKKSSNGYTKNEWILINRQLKARGKKSTFKS